MDKKSKKTINFSKLFRAIILFSFVFYYSYKFGQIVESLLSFQKMVLTGILLISIILLSKEMDRLNPVEEIEEW